MQKRQLSATELYILCGFISVIKRLNLFYTPIRWKDVQRTMSSVNIEYWVSEKDRVSSEQHRVAVARFEALNKR